MKNRSVAIAGAAANTGLAETGPEPRQERYGHPMDAAILRQRSLYLNAILNG